MPPSSLIAWESRKPTSRGKPVFYGRTGHGEMPFRGEIDPQLTEAEWEARTVQVVDACNGFFDMHVEAERRAFLDVLDAVFNNWFQLVHIERFWQGTSKHYVEWLEYYREDGTRAPMAPQRPGGAHGPRDLLQGA